MNRNSEISPVPNDADEPGETISHGDGALELEPPEEGATNRNSEISPVPNDADEPGETISHSEGALELEPPEEGATNRNSEISPVPNDADEPGETISNGDGALELEPPEEGATNRNSEISPVPNDAEEPGETISHGDGALELEPPEEGATNRNSEISPVPNDADEPGETISHGDGALELEPPEEGATIENPPNGGLRAWMIVLACTGINALFSIMQILIRVSLLDDDMSSDTGIDNDTLVEMDEQLISLSDVYTPIAAFTMIFLGYRATVCIGAGVVMTMVIYLSYLGDDDTEKFIKFILYGPTAIGMSFIQLGALVPVLEYFTTKRLKALFLSRLVSYVGQIILLPVILFSSPVKWRKFLRGCSGLCIGIGLLGLTLKELKLKMKDDESATFVQRTLGLAKKDILKNVLFWLTCIVYFFYQWGIETPQALFTDSDITGRLDLDNSVAKKFFYNLSPIIGLALGMFLAWMFKKVAYDENSRLHMDTLKADRMNIIFGILVVAVAAMGIGCFIAPHADNFGFFFPFSLLFATFFAFCEGLRHDAVPDEFGRDNVRIVEGLILMFAGLGGVITNGIGGEIDEDEPDNWKNLFRYGGGMLLFSAIVTSLVLYLNQSKVLDVIHSKIRGNTVVPLRANDGQQDGKRENARQAQQKFENEKDPKFSRPRNGKVKSSLKEGNNA